MNTDGCVECSRVVSSRQQAVTCYSCERRVHRTCNTGWHTKINSGKMNVSFYVLVPELMREADLVDLTLRLVSEEQVLRYQRKRSRDMDGRLHQYWEDYDSGEKTVTQLLRDCSKIYGPSDD